MKTSKYRIVKFKPDRYRIEKFKGFWIFKKWKQVCYDRENNLMDFSSLTRARDTVEYWIGCEEYKNEVIKEYGND